jgi:hypothetical protein
MLNSLIGIIASSGGAPAAANSYESIATVTVGAGGAANVTFSSIPSTYKHLQIRGIARPTAGTNPPYNSFMVFNSDTSANYSGHLLRGDGSSATSVSASSIAAARVAYGLASNSLSNTFNSQIIDILDYADTNKYKTVRTLGGYDVNGSGWVTFVSSLWQSTTAITSISLNVSETSGNFAQYSSFALYGIKG